MIERERVNREWKHISNVLIWKFAYKSNEFNCKKLSQSHVKHIKTPRVCVYKHINNIIHTNHKRLSGQLYMQRLLSLNYTCFKL